MDILFATKKAGKSSRENVCCQLFITDKGYVHFVCMKSKSEVLQAVKQFVKEIGRPMSSFQTLQENKRRQACGSFALKLVQRYDT
jgi:hypothetical protein